jgi:hypothetical protein
MSRAHAAEKVHGDHGGQTGCHCVAHVVIFQTSSDAMEPIGPIKAASAMRVPLRQPHLLASGMIFKRTGRREDRAPIDDYLAWSRRKPVNYKPDQ